MPIPKTIQKTSAEIGKEIIAMLRAGDEVNIPGVGRLKRVDKPARPGRNPMTKEAITIAAKTVVKFSQSSKLVEALNS